jgi:hypothetical protein
MPNRKLTTTEIATAVKLHNSIRKRLDQMSAADPELLFALRRRLIVKLTHDERGTPAHRNKIKRLKRAEQNGMCRICSKELPLKYAELDRFSASAGYTMENTRAGISTKPAEELLARMLAKVDEQCVERDRLVGEPRRKYEGKNKFILGPQIRIGKKRA